MTPAIAAAARKRVARYFRNFGATTPATAVSPPENPWYRRRHFQHMVRIGIVREVSPGRYYLDEGTLARITEAQRRTALLMLTCLGLAGAVVYVISIFANR